MPRPLQTTLIPALCLALLLAGCGRSVGTTIAPDPAFLALDADGDGRLSLQESRLSAIAFAALDLNQDGSLSQLEWRGAEADPNTALQIQVTNEERRPHRPGPGTW